MRPFDLSLYLVTDRSLSLARPLEFVVAEAVKGGVSAVQLREKECSSREFYELALQLKKILLPLDIPLIINDRLDIALAVDADGLHVGQSDLPWQIARKMLGNHKILGLSVETLAQVEEANSFDVDYIGVSPVFATPTKNDTSEPFGLEGLRHACSLSRFPAVAIGGINKSNLASIMQCGAGGVAVVSAISSAPKPDCAAKELMNIIKKTKKV
ncbi:MAG: thiamine phosphate synthase [Bacteroidales bacterium]